jgi:hypothetical protein
MDPDEDPIFLERQIRNLPPEKLIDVGKLKRILRDGLGEFEKLLNELDPHDRQAALSLYLQRMRAEAFEFHLTVLKIILKNRFQSFTSREEMSSCLDNCTRDMQKVAKLYELL